MALPRYKKPPQQMLVFLRVNIMALLKLKFLQALPPTQSQSNPTQKSEFSSMPTNVQIPDVPPIITYPEFLLHSQKPPPLITARRLLNTVYLVSGTAAAIYGTSQYLVSPMLESLDSARHSLFKTTSSNLNTMQKKLEGVVSTVPPSIANKLSNGVADGDDESSITSDPAELFHRDTGTQTSLPPSPSSPSSSASMLSPPVMTLSSQGQKLQNLQSHLSNFLSSGVELQTSDKTIQDELYEFRRYLEGVSFGRIHNHKEAIGKMGEKDDEIAKVKAEIRAVKGVLLSSKTFPAGGTRSRIGA